MSTTKKDPVLVVLQLSGGNDYLNTVIPYTDSLYRDARKAVAIPEDQVLAIDGIPDRVADSSVLKASWNLAGFFVGIEKATGDLVSVFDDSGNTFNGLQGLNSNLDEGFGLRGADRRDVSGVQVSQPRRS